METCTHNGALLLELQDGLKQVKLRHGDRVKLRRTHGVAASPFPIHIYMLIEQDRPEYEQFDQLEGLKIAVTISQAVLDRSVQRLAEAISVQVVAPQLPPCLTSKMQQTLHSQFIDQQPCQPSAVACAVTAILNLSTRLPHLLPDILNLVPQATEQYETIGPDGNTERRIKFLDVAEEVRYSVSGQSGAPDATERVAGVRAGDNEAALPDIPRAGIPDDIALLMKDLALRFPDLTPMPETAFGPTAVSAVSFTVSLLPSDPTWEHDRLSLTGKVALMYDSNSALTEPGAAREQPSRHSASTDFIAQPEDEQHTQSRMPVSAPKAEGRGMAVVLKLQPSELTDTAACAMVDQMLRKQAQAHAGKADALRLMLKYAETHLAGLVHRAWDIVLADRPGVVMEVYTAGRREVFSDSDSDETGDNICESGGSQQNHGIVGLGEAGYQRPGRNSILVTLEGLRMLGTSCLEALKLSFQVACLRCTQAAEIIFSAADMSGAASSKCPTLAASSVCTKCCQDMRITMAPHLIHDHSNTLAHLRVAGCSPVDLLPCCFGAQCDGCGALTAVRSLQPGKPASRDCQKCFRQISVSFESAAFQFVVAQERAQKAGQAAQEERSGMSSAQRRNAKRDALAAALEKLQVGQPLPNVGTCKHYRHSHRWLRFPCCGLRFPCDLCHEELTDGHEMAWAKRMICGYCSVEQAIEVKCSECGKRLAATGARPEGRKTRFWEGGKGCRDRRLLDPKDKHKYKNSNAKTVSKRAQARKSAV